MKTIMQIAVKMVPGYVLSLTNVYFTNIKRMCVNVYICSPNIDVYINVSVTWELPLFIDLSLFDYLDRREIRSVPVPFSLQ